MVDQNTRIIFLPFSCSMKVKLIDKCFFTLADLVYLNIMEFLNRDFNLFEIFCIKKCLNDCGYHFLGEEFIERQDFSDDEIKETFYRIDKLAKERNKIKEKEGFLVEEVDLYKEIMKNLNQIPFLRSKNREMDPVERIL